MEQYISKAAVVAEIKERIDRDNEMAASYPSNSEHDSFYRDKEKVYKDLLSFIDTFEVKEVDLEKEIMKYQREIYDRDTTVRDVAKHFFELGLKVQKGE